VAEFRIVTIGSATPGGLRFTDPQSDAYASTSAYAFFGNSAALSQSVTTTLSVADTLTVGDFTTDFAGVDVSSERLLTRLQFTADGGLAAGSHYRIAMSSSATEFQDPLFKTLEFEVFDGEVSTAGPGVVPVPPSLIVALSGLIPLAVWAFQRRTRATSCPAN
jgi:hypothetical protein